jgi:hypothetical protein
MAFGNALSELNALLIADLRGCAFNEIAWKHECAIAEVQ